MLKGVAYNWFENKDVMVAPVRWVAAFAVMLTEQRFRSSCFVSASDKRFSESHLIFPPNQLPIVTTFHSASFLKLHSCHSAAQKLEIHLN
jgi:hypothetical protein